MKKKEIINDIHKKLEYTYIDVNNLDFIIKDVINEAVALGMLPPERPDEHPLGYGAAWLSDEDVMINWFKFKHSWEPEDEKK